METPLLSQTSDRIEPNVPNGGSEVLKTAFRTY